MDLILCYIGFMVDTVIKCINWDGNEIHLKEKELTSDKEIMNRLYNMAGESSIIKKA
jgi:hypothetical protein